MAQDDVTPERSSLTSLENAAYVTGLALPLDEALAQVVTGVENCIGYELQPSQWIEGYGNTFASVTFQFSDCVPIRIPFSVRGDVPRIIPKSYVGYMTAALSSHRMGHTEATP